MGYSTSPAYYYVRASSGVDLYLGANSTEGQLVIKQSGKIGIGTTAPDTQLHVVGNAKFTGGIVGRSDGSNTSTANVGAYISSTVPAASAVTITSGQYTDITMLSFPPGDWDVSISCVFTNGPVTGTYVIGGLGTASGTGTTGLVSGTTRSESSVMPSAAGVDSSLAFPRMRVNVTTTTNYYLKVSGSFSAGTLKAYGTINGRKM
jgi:hypothetical protein